MPPFAVSTVSTRPPPPTVPAGRHLHRELDGHIVVAHVHAAALARRAFVPFAVAAGIHGANRHAFSVLHDIDRHRFGIAPARPLLSDDLHFVAAGGLCDYVAV